MTSLPEGGDQVSKLFCEDELRAPSGSGAPAPEVSKASVCVINYNGEGSLERILGSIREQGRALDEVILVDNASTDRSLEIVRSGFPEVRIVRLSENRGPGPARNAGIREARSRYVLVMDNDVALAPSCLEHLTRALVAYPSAAAAMPRVLYAHDPEIVQYDGAGYHFIGLMTLENPDTPVSVAPSRVRPIGSLVTAAFLLDRERVGTEEPFDESFFIYQEDHDFAVGLRARGWELISVPEAHCYHGSGTEGLSIRRIGEYSSRRVYNNIRNRWVFVLKNYSLRSLVLLSPVLLLFEMAQLAVALRKGWIGAWLRAFGSVLGGLPGLVRSRRRTQRARVRPDRELMEGGPLPLRSELTATGLERGAKRLLDRVAGGYWRLVSRAI